MASRASVSVLLGVLLVPGLASAKMIVPLDDPRVIPDPPADDPPAAVPPAVDPPIEAPPAHLVRAVDDESDPPPPPPPRKYRLEMGLGWRVGSQLVDGLGAGTVHAAHVEGGVRLGRTFLALEYQLSELQLEDTAFSSRGGGPVFSGNGRGLEHRLGANARYSFARVAESDGGFDMYAEGGIGVEHDVWDSGGVLTRPDISLGIGGAIYGQGEHRHGGTSMGLRVTLAHRDDLANAGVACGGPCDRATTPTGIDRSFMFDITVMLGN